MNKKHKLNYRDELNYYEFHKGDEQRSFLMRSIFALLFILSILIVIWAGIEIYQSGNQVNGNQIIKPHEALSSIFLVGALIISYIQWRAARQEASLEKFYERLDIANRRLGDIVQYVMQGKDPDQLPKDTKFKADTSMFDMWIFAELDNLEYVKEKYKLGYIRDEDAYRGLETFISRCKNNEVFKDKVISLCKRAGYQKDTIDTVAKACENIK